MLVYFAETGSIDMVHRQDYFADITNGVDKDGKQQYTKWYLSQNVTHWMVLPDPPNAAGELQTPAEQPKVNDIQKDSEQLESAGAVSSNRLLAIATAALERIAKCEDAPNIDATGEWQTGLHCGVEDRDCQDRYQGADYGHTVGVEKALEWASNEAKHALGQMANVERTNREQDQLKQEE